MSHSSPKPYCGSCSNSHSMFGGLTNMSGFGGALQPMGSATSIGQGTQQAIPIQATQQPSSAQPSAAMAGSFGQGTQSSGQLPHPNSGQPTPPCTSGQPSCPSSGWPSCLNTSSSGTTFLIGNVTVSLANNTSWNSILQSGFDSDSEHKFLNACPETYRKNINEDKYREIKTEGK